MEKGYEKIQIVTWSSPDQVGLLSKITSIIAKQGGNLLEVIQYTDPDEEWFFLRAEIDIGGLKGSKIGIINQSLRQLSKMYRATIKIKDKKVFPKVAILASREGHCLTDILWRWESRELPIEPKVVISNHTSLKGIVAHYKLPYKNLNITKENKDHQFKEIGSLFKLYDVDTVILARFMQILPKWLCTKYQNGIINIHHSFLPSFKGADPYGQAFARGVKIIGATSHYVTPALDEGPIIEQEVKRISHFHTKSDLLRLGKDCERLALSRAICLHAQSRIFVHKDKTIILGE